MLTLLFHSRRTTAFQRLKIRGQSLGLLLALLMCGQPALGQSPVEDVAPVTPGGAPVMSAVGVSAGIAGSTARVVINDVVDQAKTRGIDGVDLGRAVDTVSSPDFARSVVVSSTLGQAARVATASLASAIGPGGPLLQSVIATTASVVGFDLVDGDSSKDWKRVGFVTVIGILSSTYLTAGLPLFASVIAGIAMGVAADEIYDGLTAFIRQLQRDRFAHRRLPGVRAQDTMAVQSSYRSAPCSLLGVPGQL